LFTGERQDALLKSHPGLGICLESKGNTVMNITIQNRNPNYQDRLARELTARLNEGAQQLPHEISERLKAARMQALSKRKVVKLQLATDLSVHGTAVALHMGGEHRSVWNRLASFLPLLALVAGLLAIDVLQEQNRADELAEVDAELLTDDLPPEAFTDPGFMRFLSAKVPN
jgi:hypothetical protein